MVGSLNLKAFGKTLAIVAVISVIGNVLLTMVGKMVSAPPSTFGPYMYSSVIGLTLGGVVAAGVVYAITHWLFVDVAKANRYFVIISIIVLIASFYPDVAMPWSTDLDQVGWTYGIMANLMLMHVLTAGIVLYGFTRIKSHFSIDVAALQA